MNKTCPNCGRNIVNGCWKCDGKRNSDAPVVVELPSNAQAERRIRAYYPEFNDRKAYFADYYQKHRLKKIEAAKARYHRLKSCIASS